MIQDILCLAAHLLICISTWAGYEWRSTSARHSSPDTVSPLYPDRPIRPLPKRRLRNRLSPEQAESITYPQQPVTSPPLFNFPYSNTEKVGGVSTRQQRERERKCSCGADHTEPESDEEDDERLATSGMGLGKSKPTGSTSSADGYESFENTNNKKKRKIPVSGSAGHHGNLTAEMASMGISAHGGGGPVQDDGENNVGQYYGSGSSAVPVPGSGTGISGAGRGRYGRSARFSNERRPLGASTTSLNAYANGSGIISTAIANANAAGQPPQNKQGQENVSLLQQEAAKTTPQKTQFTFTCGSPNQMTNRGVATQGTQTSPLMNGAQQQQPQGQQQQQGQAAPPPNGQQPPAQAPKKPRRRPEKIYAMAARRRRLQQEYANYHHPPSREDIWICEFCEYENIFGEPPRALIKQYEIKDRKEQKRIAEKRRLLEKAKMKGRKNKKANKNAKNAAANNNNQHAQSAPQDGQHYDDQGGRDHVPLDADGNEFYDDEYEDEHATMATMASLLRPLRHKEMRPYTLASRRPNIR
ncbi:hypothetical protein K490DRAFT_73908 [Saccharata proteae CBS 121410]|uniref:Uncharacterized protein n=1 Tax=Saccharata proteae CBS 121410 TaxID=1314787 RepID=A0A9P4HUQ1_9PEZI|nr:hypothetical protein K490DRAFT_73908 [Saccharata proteae CBS 121410]